MAGFSRQKGARGEREIATMFRELGFDVQRNALQTAVGGADLTGLPGIAVEIKRVETPFQEAWWAQAVSQATNGRRPVLFYRRSRQPWRVRTHVSIDGRSIPHIVADITATDFLHWYVSHHKTH